MSTLYDLTSHEADFMKKLKMKIALIRSLESQLLQSDNFSKLVGKLCQKLIDTELTEKTIEFSNLGIFLGNKSKF